jgi:hypothetical protein
MTTPNYLKEVNLDIAGLGIKIRSNSSIVLDGLEKRYKNFILSDACKEIFQIEIETLQNKFFLFESKEPILSYSQTGRLSITTHACFGDFLLQDWTGTIKIDAQAELKTILNETEYLLRCLYAFMVFSSGGLLVHASGIVIEKLGYIFIGKSGAGKSTIIRNSKDKDILGDDMLVVYPSSNGWFVMSTPFTNPDLHGIKPNRARLGKINYLRKSLSTYSEEVTTSEAVAELAANVPVVPTISEFTPEVLERCKRIVSENTCIKLHFLPDHSFLNVI